MRRRNQIDEELPDPPVPLDRRIIPFNSIVIDDEEVFQNARLLENESKDVLALAKRIGDKGLLNPLVVYEDAEQKLHLRVGFRRYRAIKLLDWKEVEVKVLPSKTTLVDQYWANLEENSQRSQLTAFELATRAVLMMEKFEVPATEVARYMNEPTSKVQNLVRWLRMLPDAIKDDWRRNHPFLTLTLLEDYSHMHPEEATLAWYEHINRATEEETFGKIDRQEKKKKRHRASPKMLGVLYDYIQHAADLSKREREIAAQVCQFALGERRIVPGIYEPEHRNKSRSRARRAIRLPKQIGRKWGGRQIPDTGEPK